MLCFKILWVFAGKTMIVIRFGNFKKIKMKKNMHIYYVIVETILNCPRK